MENANLCRMAEKAAEDLELSVVVPVYNEIGCLDELARRLAEALDEAGIAWEAVVVDDGSTDGSGDHLDRLAAADLRLRVLHFTVNCGQSAALDAGFQHSRARFVALLDADLQTFPEDLPPMLARVRNGEADAVVGIREQRQDSGIKRISALVANGVRNRITREDIVDTGCPIKVFRGDAIRSITMYDGMHRFLPTLLRLQGYTVVQAPVRHASRLTGDSKYGILDRAFRALRDALAVRWMKDRHLDWTLC